MSERPPSEFLLILIPQDDSSLEIEVREFSTAQEQDDALREAQAAGYWRDLIGIYRHHNGGPLGGQWWGGPSTIYERRFYRDARLAPTSEAALPAG